MDRSRDPLSLRRSAHLVDRWIEDKCYERVAAPATSLKQALRGLSVDATSEKSTWAIQNPAKLIQRLL
jgi:hypothetical protein